MLKATGRAGFTFLEVMLVVAIIGILAVVGTASLQRSTEMKKAKAATMEVHSILKLAASEVRKRESDMSVRVSDELMQVWWGTGCADSVLYSSTIAQKGGVEDFAGATATGLTSTGAVDWVSGSIACIDFETGRRGLNPVKNEGWMRIKAGGDPLYTGLIVKRNDDNRFLRYYSTGGDSSWIEF
jgi:prepilin-type N-terminal cleavage/methylation domain-containing protein